MLAGVRYARAYLLGLNGDYAAGLANLRRAEALYESIGMPYHALTARADARRTTEEFRKRILSIDTARWFADRRPISASIGVTVSTTADTPSTMLRRADTAPYAVKHVGRNCVRSDPSLDPHVDSHTADAQTRDLSGHGGAASPAEP